MSKEKNFNVNNDFVSYKNEKIVFCQDGRIFFIDKDTELVDLRDCENCKQKEQRIAELETALHEYFINNENLAEQLRIVRENNLLLEKQLAEKDKLLENAIVPKFKLKNKRVYVIHYGNDYFKTSPYVGSGFISAIMYDNGFKYKLGVNTTIYQEKDLFTTKEQAEEALLKLDKRRSK